MKDGGKLHDKIWDDKKKGLQDVVASSRDIKQIQEAMKQTAKGWFQQCFFPGVNENIQTVKTEKLISTLELDMGNS